MSANDCTCGTAVLERSTLERPRFFPRQLITPDDLTLGQDYLRNKIRRINRYLHGWGVVCGARVVQPAKAQAWKVVIQTGYILGPFGDEIVLDREICFDLRTRCMEAASGEIMRVCVEAGGSITGEHGVGLDKIRYMPLIFGPDDLGAMAAVRAAFDPSGRANPGKVIPTAQCREWTPWADAHDARRATHEHAS